MDIRIINISKKFKSAEEKYINCLTQISVDINYGNYVSFVGPSGSGKTTLLNIITGLLSPTSGDVFWGKNSLQKSPNGTISNIRKRSFGIVAQETQFVNELNVHENIVLPLIINYSSLLEKRKYYTTLMDRLNISKLAKRFPFELSGGERRKVAIARALIGNPQVLVADEPTANLDDISAREVFNIFQNLNKLGLTIVIATHDERFGKFCKETYYMRNGKIEKFSAKR